MADAPNSQNHPQASCGVDDIDGGGIAENSDGGDEEDTLGGDAGGAAEEGESGGSGYSPKGLAKERHESEEEDVAETHDDRDQLARAPDRGPSLDEEIEEREGDGGGTGGGDAEAESSVVAGAGAVEEGDAQGRQRCCEPELGAEREAEKERGQCGDEDGFESEDGRGHGDIAAGEGIKAQGLADDEEEGEQSRLPELGRGLSGAAQPFEGKEEDGGEGV